MRTTKRRISVDEQDRVTGWGTVSDDATGADVFQEDAQIFRVLSGEDAVDEYGRRKHKLIDGELVQDLYKPTDEEATAKRGEAKRARIAEELPAWLAEGRSFEEIEALISGISIE